MIKQYIYCWFHHEPVSPEQVELFMNWLEDKPRNDLILKGQAFGAGRRKYTTHYSPDQARDVADLFFNQEMEEWRTRHQKEFAALTEEELWTKFNSHYLSFLIDHNPAKTPHESLTRADRTEKQFADEASEEPSSAVTLGPAFLEEASREWHAVSHLLRKVASGVLTPEAAFEKFLALAERYDLRLDRRSHVGPFVRSSLRRVPGVSKTQLGHILGLSADTIRRLGLQEVTPRDPAHESHEALSILNSL